MTPRICEVCGHENDTDDWRRCAFCNRLRGTWVCRWCGRKHCETAQACLACGQKKGTSPPDHSG